jgi:hypothetical protein
VTITLPNEIRAEAEAKAKAAGFSSVDAYVAYLVSTDTPEEEETFASAGPPELTPRNRAELEAMIEEGMNSGPGVVADEAFWERFKQKIRSGATRRTGPQP